MSEFDAQLVESTDSAWWAAWQAAPPSFLQAPELDGCVLMAAAEPAVTPYSPVYDSLGILVSSCVVGFIALREMRTQLRLVRALEVVEPYVAEAAPEVARSKSGIEAKQDVEAHTAHGKKLGRTG